jgi:hypothetical protein
MISTCCKTTVSVGGEGSTHYFVCGYCGLPCKATSSWTATIDPTIEYKEPNWFQRLIRKLFL